MSIVKRGPRAAGVSADSSRTKGPTGPRVALLVLQALVLNVVATPARSAPPAPGQITWVPIGVGTVTWVPIRRGPPLAEGATCRLGVQCDTRTCRDAVCV